MDLGELIAVKHWYLNRNDRILKSNCAFLFIKSCSAFGKLPGNKHFSSPDPNIGVSYSIVHLMNG